MTRPISILITAIFSLLGLVASSLFAITPMPVPSSTTTPFIGYHATSNSFKVTPDPGLGNVGFGPTAEESAAARVGGLSAAPAVFVAAESLLAVEQGAAKVPSAWGEGLGNRKGVGRRWFNPADKGDGIRIDRGVPGSPFLSQQVDHGIVRSGGQIFGPDGKAIVGRLRDDHRAHIPLSDWLKWTTWKSP